MAANSRGAVIFLGVTAIFVAGCSLGIQGYRLSHQDNAEILIPPGVTLPAKGALEVPLQKARIWPFPAEGCDVDRGPIGIRWRGSTAYLRAKPDSGLLGFGQRLVNEPPVALDPRGSMRGQPIALDPVQFISGFRADLIALEENGCLHRGEGQALAASVAEKLPLQPFLGYVLRFGAFDLNQFIDLTPDFRLRVVYPVYASDDHAETKELKGAETVYYKIVPDTRSGQVRITQVAVDSSQDGRSSRVSATRIASPFPHSFAYFRLFLKRSLSSKEPVTVAIIVSSTQRKNLDEATQKLDADAEPSCLGVTSPNATCTRFPMLTGVNAEIRVKVNGKEVFARLGAQVSEAVREEGGDASPSVQVKRLFGKRLVPVKRDGDNRDILGLILMPGDVINYH